MKTPYTFCQIAADQLHVPQIITELYSDNTAKATPQKTTVTASSPQPPFLIEEKTQGVFALLTGFHRFIQAQRAKVKELPCYLLAPDLDSKTKYSLIVSYGTYEPDISPIEEALLVSNGQQELNQSELFDLLKMMGYSPNNHQLRELRSLLEMDRQVQQAVHNGRLSLKTFKKLNQLTHSDQKTVISLIERYRLGGSKQNNLINMAIELTKRLNTSFAEIIEHWSEKEFIDTHNLPQQAADLLGYLNNQCSPESLAAEQTFTRRVHQLQLPQSLTIHHSSNFELDTCELTISFKNMDTLERHLPAIRNLLQNQWDNA
ncbi:MAG: hypothetical protein CSA31_02185 [Desulfobulbus propionicus]|nr:MAG: hypothetical protein CSB34_06480 [Desulfobulbus propionicus]PIE60401.1 MAG: hypothetical protein CSA31_02185 [Desulfobulbus propionicus]